MPSALFLISCRTLSIVHCHRIQKNPLSTHWCASWRRGVCCLRNISVPAVSRETLSGITVLQARSIHILPVLFVATRVCGPCNTRHLPCVHLHFSDVLVHRQLAAAIGYTPLHPSLHSKMHVERIMEVVNRRHRMAQMAGRASVEFYVGLALKGRNEREKEVTEDAFVIRTFRNGLGVFVSK